MNSEHFQDSELRCHHCMENKVTAELLDALEKFRTLAGNRPVHVDSAYRCPAWNAKIGGVTDSQHLVGCAADIRISGMLPSALEKIARQIPEIRGIGRADMQGYLHIDVRESIAVVAWCYDQLGHQTAYYPSRLEAEG
jgi:uncharacterized protein YcbK (DUF882 family)